MKASQNAAPKPAILVVDDEANIRDILSEYLTMTGYPVLQAANTEEALALAEHRSDLRLIITDYRMPGSSGLDLVDRAQARRPDLKFIVVSAALPPESTSLRCLKKPFRLRDLQQAVHEELGASA